MPSTYAHYRFGQDVLKALPAKYRDTLLQEEDLFNIGLHGPDLLFYYKPFSHHPLHAEGGRMHRLTGREFFTEAGRTFLERGARRTAPATAISTTSSATGRSPTRRSRANSTASCLKRTALTLSAPIWPPTSTRHAEPRK